MVTPDYCKTFKTKKPPDTKETGNAILPVFADETTTIICKERNANS